MGSMIRGITISAKDAEDDQYYEPPTRVLSLVVVVVREAIRAGTRGRVTSAPFGEPAKVTFDLHSFRHGHRKLRCRWKRTRSLYCANEVGRDRCPCRFQRRAAVVLLKLHERSSIGKAVTSDN
jgi:hypothetical protein